MKNNIYEINATNFTPLVIIDYDKKYIKMVGKSIPNDAYRFYSIITTTTKHISGLTFEVDLEYINSSSLKFLSLSITSELNLKKVLWYYDSDDDDIFDKGELIKDITSRKRPEIIFELIEKL